MEKKKPQLHVSGLEMLSKCGEQFRRRYIEREKIPPGVALIVGSATHKSIEKNLKSVINNGGLLPLEEIKDTARDALVNNWNSGVMLNDDEMKDGLEKTRAGAIDKAVRLSELHATKKAPEIRPTHIERKWNIELPNYPMDLVGQIDIQEGSIRIRDSKTSGKTPAKTIADESIQLTAYALAVKIIDGKEVSEVSFDYLIDTKEPQALSFSSTRTNEDFQVLLRRIENAIIVIEKGSFMPARETDWWCGQKWCGYWNSCKFATKKPKQFAVGG